MNSLNLHLLRIFKTVVELQNFSRAAEALYISQPAVSRSIQELEQQIGSPLIDRSTRRFALTETGALLYEHARQIFAAERAAVTALEQIQSLERGKLSVGASHTTGAYLVPACLALFHRRYPGIRLGLKIANTHDVVEQLLDAIFDIGFIEGPIGSGEVTRISWRRDRLVVIVAPDHPLAMMQPVPLAAVLVQPMVMREEGSGSRHIVERYFAEQEKPIHSVIELNSNQAVKQSVMEGLGIGIVSELMIRSEQLAGLITVLDVAGFHLERQLSYIMRKNQPVTPVLQAFLPVITECALLTPP